MLKRKGKNFRLIYIAISILLIFLIFFVSLDKRLRPIITDYSASVGETLMIKLVDETVAQIFEEEGVEYDDLVTLSRDENGNVTSLQINTAKINYIKSNISVMVAEKIAQKERYTLKIPLGTIIGNEYTVGRGPDIKFKMQITTTVIADFESRFYSAGINQALHQIHIKVKMNGQTVIPWYRSAFNLETSVIAAETVIVGITPDAYTNVIESGTDVTEDVFDFGTH
ncbi:MAG: sporulation protein YunB [Ruminococcaceae bacterium]|nr:sporulation protein YunB [Oscillospiraceae bacterium]